VNDLNRAVFLALNGTADSPHLLVLFAVFAAKYLIALVPLHLVLVWIGGDRKMRFVALSSLLALVIAIVVNQAIGFVAYSPRPFLIGLGTQLIEHRDSSSLPSNHATVFFAYAATLLIFRMHRLGMAVAAMGLLVAWSRIFLGIHFPLDMLAAAVTSTAAAFAAVWIMARRGSSLLNRIEALYNGLIGGVAAAIRGERP
jgi:undecaprenyl-diphosphatase